MPEELWMEVGDIVQEALIKTIPKEKRLSGGTSSKETACQCGDVGDVGLIPKPTSSAGEGNGTHSSILAW